MTPNFSFHRREIAKISKRYYSKYCYFGKSAIVLERLNFYVYSNPLYWSNHPEQTAWEEPPPAVKLLVHMQT